MVGGNGIAALENGTVPWRKPWSAAGGGRPRSMSTGQPYRGINVLLLGTEAMGRGYGSPWWGTYHQIAQLSGMEPRQGRRGGRYWASPDGGPRGVRKGEHGCQILLWKTVPAAETDPGTGETVTREILLAKLFTVFNAEQADGLPGTFQARPGQPADAYYSALHDLITLPGQNQFGTVEAYYDAAFHEAVHSTGHASRLARPSLTTFSHDRAFGDELYAREELVAQMGSAMLQAETGIEGRFGQSAAYIAGWLTALRNDPGLVPHAAACAQRACDLITQPQRQATAQPQPEREAAA